MSCRGRTLLMIVSSLLILVIVLTVSRSSVKPSVAKQLTRSVYNGQLLRSPGECEADLLVGVVSPAAGRSARLAVRNSWGGWAGQALTSSQEKKNLSRRMETFLRKKLKKFKTEETGKPYSVRIIFLVGSSPDNNTMLSLDQEADTFKDLLISSNPEGYSNLPLKTLTLMDYYLAECKSSRYLLKVDDDVFLRVPLLLKYLEALDKQDFALGGRLNLNRSPHRQLKYKYSVSRDQYSLEKYPPFLSGPCYLMSSYAVSVIYREALEMEYFPLEDVFITGLAVNQTSLKLDDLQNFLTDKNLSHAFRGGQDYVGYHGLNVSSMDSFWKRYLDSVKSK